MKFCNENDGSSTKNDGFLTEQESPGLVTRLVNGVREMAGLAKL